MRSRSWRRHIEEKVLVKRLRRFTYNNWFGDIDINKNWYQKLLVIDFLEKKEHFISKTLTTQVWDSRHKVKYSPNKSKPYYRDGKKRFSTRENNKILLTKILKENGII
jgi:hypothetical protein